MPGRCCRSEAGEIPALSRNCDGRRGDEPGRLRCAERAALVGGAVSTAPAGKPLPFPREKRGGFGVELQGPKVSGDSPCTGAHGGLWEHTYIRADDHEFVPTYADHLERPSDVVAPTNTNRVAVCYLDLGLVSGRRWEACRLSPLLLHLPDRG